MGLCSLGFYGALEICILLLLLLLYMWDCKSVNVAIWLVRPWLTHRHTHRQLLTSQLTKKRRNVFASMITSELPAARRCRLSPAHNNRCRTYFRTCKYNAMQSNGNKRVSQHLWITGHSLHQRAHNLTLPSDVGATARQNFIMRMLFTDMYWWSFFTFQMLLCVFFVHIMYFPLFCYVVTQVRLSFVQ